MWIAEGMTSPAVEHLLHHRAVKLGGVAAGPLVPGANFIVDRGEQRAGAAGEVAYAQLSDGVGVRPVDALHLGDGQPCQERGGRGQRVEGGEVLAVRDELLEDAPGQVVRVVHARRAERLRGVPQPPQDGCRFARRKLPEDVLRDGEDGPVVDLQDVVPGGEHLALGVVHAVAAHPGQRIDLRVHPGDAFVEDECVGDDGAGHAAGLRHVDHSQAAGYGGSDARPQLRNFVQQRRGPFDALFQRGGGLVYGALRNAHQTDHVGQVLDAALQPAGLRKASCVRAALGKDAVFEAGRRQGGAQVVGIADRGRVAEGDCGFDDAPVDGHLQPEAGRGLRLHGAGGHVLGLDHHGRTAGRGDDDVRAQSGMADDGLGVLGPHLPAGQHLLEQAAQGVVGVRLGLAWHIGL